jgi:hypothetical protein
MRFALDFAVVVIVGSPLVGMLAGHLRARSDRQNLSVPRANTTLT